MIAIAMAAVLALQQGTAVTADSTRQPNGRVTPVASAVRAGQSTPAPRIDGHLDDPIWSLAQPATTFTQQRPSDGSPATERTEVRVAYDGEAVYVGARMFDSRPDGVAAVLGRRDELPNQSDMFEVDIDSYHDHQTSFQFYVNPLGQRADMVGNSDFPYGDTGWDPVWEAAAARDSLGWTAELKIPLSQLRFPSADSQTWGVNFYRWVARKGELTMWSHFAQTAAGYASNFGHLTGLMNLPQPRRLELLPYVAANEERLASGSPANPFNDGSREVARAGLDAQYGLTSNLTLNATVNPDFGQVEADPAVVNLTAYETFFQERRPFFVEGSGIFRAVSPGIIPVNGPQYLYSRRVGRAPQGGVPWGVADYADVPPATTILGAGKLSGRTAGGWSLGLLEAATAAEHATLDVAGARSRLAVEPFTNYTVARARNDFGSGATSLGFTATAVNRRIDDQNLAWLRTSAYAGGLDFSRRFRQNAYSMFAAVGGSYVGGDRLAIQATQLSSARYYQRPDAHHVRYQPDRTSLSGWFAALGGAKDQGPLQVGSGVDAWSPGFEINDLGWQSRVDRINWYGRVIYIWNRPSRVFQTAQLQTQEGASWNFDGDRTSTWIYTGFNGQLQNYWGVGWGAQVNLRSVNDALLRGGPAGISPAAVTSDVSFSTDFRKRLRFSMNVLGSWNEIGYRDFYLYTSLAFQPTHTVSLSVGPTFDLARTPQQYVAAMPDSTATSTYLTRYVFGTIRQHTLDLTTRVSWTLSPALSVQLYVQPFIATGEYLDYRELVRPRSLDYVVYGVTPGSTRTPLTDGAGHVVGYELDPDGAGARPAVTVPNLDFSYRSLRGNAVVRWEYRPGSTLFFVWTQSCSAFAPNPAFSATGDLGRLCQGRGDNVFAVKLNYWLSL